MIYYQDNLVWWYNKDCRDMSELSDESVQCVVTSPPYWGLRKYSGMQDLMWGGNKNCRHDWVDSSIPKSGGVGDYEVGRVGNAKARSASHEKKESNTCSLCGAWKGQYGLEPTPEMYIQHTIEILREIRRVLRKDGVVFWNIGDSYSGSGRGADGKYANPSLSADSLAIKPDWNISGLKPKDLCLIPFRVAIAAQEDGWWVRSIIIWSKPNPMPESVTDRPTESHEYILMLTKSGTSQYWTHRDHEGTRSQPKPDYRWVRRNKNIRGLKTKGDVELSLQEQHHGQDITPEIEDIIEERDTAPEGWTPKNKMGWDRINLWRGHDYYWDADAVREGNADPQRTNFVSGSRSHGLNPDRNDNDLGERSKDFVAAGRNIRSVWEFPTQPYPEAHFAVFPEKLPETCIKASTPEVGCCSKCGAPWERVTEQQSPEGDGKLKYDSKFSEDATGLTPQGFHRTASIENERSASRQEAIEKFPSDSKAQQRYINQIHDHGGIRRIKTLGWQPTCKCNADKVPSIVLDPFMGSGTVMWVAKKLGRRGVGYELSGEYCQLALERNRQQVLELKV